MPDLASTRWDGLLKFNDQLLKIDSPTSCSALFREMIEPFGYDTFASGEIDLVERSRTVFTSRGVRMPARFSQSWNGRP